MNCFDLIKKMVELDNEVLELSNQLGKISNVSERENRQGNRFKIINTT